MKKDYKHWDDPSQTPELLKHYELLRSLGVWEYHEYLKNQIRDNDGLLDMSLEIFQKNSIEELLQYVTTHLLNKVIPSSMAYILFDEYTKEVGEAFFFQNMKLVPADIRLSGLSEIQQFFIQYPNPIQFSLFEYQLKNGAVSDQFHQLSPDIIVPITGIGGFHGCIVFSQKILGEEYSQEELSYISRLMAFASVSIQNNIHHKNAITDRKTSLYNHGYFLKRLEEELSRVYRYKSSLALVVLDIDHFKNFNDSYGHLAGDLILEKFARVLQKSVRRGDIPARFGGEEFVVLLVSCSQEASWNAAERIRLAIEGMSLEYEGKTLGVTASLGICFANEFLRYTSTELIERADKALYNSKKNGRKIKK